MFFSVRRSRVGERACVWGEVLEWGEEEEGAWRLRTSQRSEVAMYRSSLSKCRIFVNSSSMDALDDMVIV